MKALRTLVLGAILFSSLGAARSAFAQVRPPMVRQVCTVRHTLITLGFNVIEVYALYKEQGLIRNYVIDDYQIEGRSRDAALNAAFDKAEQDAKKLEEEGVCYYLK